MGTLSHDDQRHGTTAVSAALAYLTDILIGTRLPHHQRLRFLDRINAQIPPSLALRQIADNHAVHRLSSIPRPPYLS
ncbi:MAG TPA: hypothetical protein VLT62_03845 [Candidatus Methylomirabilis sp.]|nr:hypothetical protein [Candidatus Methylomirabilis sp.]